MDKQEQYEQLKRFIDYMDHDQLRIYCTNVEIESRRLRMAWDGDMMRDFFYNLIDKTIDDIILSEKFKDHDENWYKGYKQAIEDIDNGFSRRYERKS